MIKIYFDDQLIDDENYVQIKNEFNMFDEEFYLGASSSNTFDITIPSNAIETIPEKVTIEVDEELYATLIVDDYNYKDNNKLELKLVDKMVNLNKGYDASSIVPCTTGDIYQDILETYGIEAGTLSFTNDDIEVNYYDNTIAGIEYMQYIAELNGGYSQIGPDGKHYLKEYTDSLIRININECSDFKLGQKHKIERVVFDNGLLKFETSSDESLETLYLNQNNVFINTESVFNKIASKILNFEFYSVAVSNCPIDSSVRAGDIITFYDDDNNEYPTIAQYSLDYNGSWIGGYSLEINSKQRQETKIKGTEEKYKSLKVSIDRNLNEIATVASQVQTLDVTVENNYQEVISKFDNYVPSSDIVNIENSVTKLQTDTYTKTEINTKLTDGSVTKVNTTSGTFDENGMHYEKSGAPTSTTINYAGVEVGNSTSGDELLFAGYDENLKQTIVRTDNLTVKKYLVVGENSRIEDYENGGGIFVL